MYPYALVNFDMNAIISQRCRADVKSNATLCPPSAWVSRREQCHVCVCVCAQTQFNAWRCDMEELIACANHMCASVQVCVCGICTYAYYDCWHYWCLATLLLYWHRWCNQTDKHINTTGFWRDLQKFVFVRRLSVAWVCVFVWNVALRWYIDVCISIRGVNTVCQKSIETRERQINYLEYGKIKKLIKSKLFSKKFKLKKKRKN